MNKEPTKDHMNGVAEGRKSATAQYKDFMASEIHARIEVKQRDIDRLYAEINELGSIKKYTETIK